MTPAATGQPRLAVQAFWLTFSKVVAALINIALPIILVRQLDQTEYGVYRQVFVFSATAVSISTLGVGVSAFYFMPREPARGGQIALNILIYNFIAGSIPLLVLLLYPRVLRDVFRVPALEAYAVSLGLVILLTLSATFLYQIPTALQDVKNSTMMIVGTQFSKAVLFAGTAVLFPTVQAMVTVAIVHQCIQSIVLVRYLHRKFGRFWTQFDWAFFREQIAYALPMGAFGVLNVLQRDVHNYFVSASFSPADFAIYSVGCMQAPLVPVVLESVAAVMAIRVSALQHEGRHREVLRVTAGAVNQLAAIQFPIAALLFILGRDLIVLMYTRAYEQSAGIFAVNVFLLPLGVLLLDPIIRGYTELRGFIFTVRVVIFIALVFTLYVSIQQLGMIGAVLASLIAVLAERVAVAWRASRLLGATMKDLALFTGLFKVTGVTVVTGFAASLIHDLIDPDLVILRIAITGTAFALMYLAAVYVFKLPGSEELRKERLIAYARKAMTKVKRKPR